MPTRSTTTTGRPQRAGVAARAAAPAPSAAVQAPVPGRAPGVTSCLVPALLGAHQPQGDSNDCGPFAVAMALGALLGPGRAATPDALARAMDRPRWGGLLGILPLVRRIPRSATFPWGLADAAREAGLVARWRPLAGTDHLLAALVRGEAPLVYVGGWRPRPWGHVAVLAAWDPERGWGFADSLSPRAEIVWRPDAVFRRQWRALGRQLVVLRPATASKEPRA